MKEHNQRSTHKDSRDDQLFPQTDQGSSKERSRIKNIDETSDEMGDLNQPELPVEGRVISWLTRKEDGAIVMGDLCPPGNYTLIPCPEESNPNELRGKNVAGNHAGWFSTPGDMSLEHTVPNTAGVYLLVKPTQE